MHQQASSRESFKRRISAHTARTGDRRIRDDAPSERGRRRATERHQLRNAVRSRAAFAAGMTGDSRLFDLSGRVAIVTGAARGLGRALAQGLAHHGARVVACDINVDGANATAESIKSAGGNRNIRPCRRNRRP